MTIYLCRNLLQFLCVTGNFHFSNIRKIMKSTNRNLDIAYGMKCNNITRKLNENASGTDDNIITVMCYVV